MNASTKVNAFTNNCWNFLSKRFRNLSSNILEANTVESLRQRRNHLFEKEKKRQLSLIPRLEKIEVHYKGVPEDVTLIMNKNLSTPYDCALHIQEGIRNRSVVALVNGKLWDMHYPLVDNCELQLLHFLDDDPYYANKMFWRSCSFMLGYVVETAFKEDIEVQLHSWPPPNVRTGSFVYDVYLDLQNWIPKSEELRMLTYVWNKINQKELNFERIDTNLDVALEIFKYNKFKLQQIPNIAAQSKDGTVTLYKLGDHVDISRGPMIANTRLFGRIGVSAVHQIQTKDFGPLYRFQGISLPKQLPLNYYTWSMLEDRSKVLNSSALPSLSQAERRKIKLENTEESKASL